MMQKLYFSLKHISLYFNLKRIFSLLLSLILFNAVFANNIISDSVANINCNHDGFIFTEIVSLDTNVFSKWYFYNDSLWEQIDTSDQLIVINNNQYNSDSLLQKFVAYIN